MCVCQHVQENVCASECSRASVASRSHGKSSFLVVQECCLVQAQLKAAKGADGSAAAAAASGAPAAAAAASDSKAPPLMSRVSILDIGFADAKSVSYTLAQLQDKANPPANIDVLKKELYCTSE
jgi:hypothetical protein